MNRERAGPPRDESGFTLIELLVVMIIIGILAGIAIPVFMSERSKGYDTQAKNDLRNLAENEEAHLVDYDTYGPIAQLELEGYPIKISKDDTLSVVYYNGSDSICMSAKSSHSTHVWYWDNQSGGLEPNGALGCSVTTAGTAGDSITGVH